VPIHDACARIKLCKTLPIGCDVALRCRVVRKVGLGENDRIGPCYLLQCLEMPIERRRAVDDVE
jgi:hypothetical protein